MEDVIMLEECPVCRGAGMIMHEGGWNVQVECCDCSAHTVYVEYSNEEEKVEPTVQRGFGHGGFADFIKLNPKIHKTPRALQKMSIDNEYII